LIFGPIFNGLSGMQLHYQAIQKQGHITKKD